MSTFILSSDELKQYIDEGLSAENISIIYDCKKRKILELSKRYNLEIPPRFSYKSGKNKAGRKKGCKWTDRQKLLMKGKFIGEDNPFWGRSHSDKTKKQMSKNHADFTGDRNPFRQSILSSDDNRKAHSDRCFKLWMGRDKTWRKKFAEKLSKSMAGTDKLKNNSVHKNYDCGFIETIKAGKIYCRSSWEKIVAKLLDSNSLVVKFQLEPFTIPFYDHVKNMVRYTRIDFFVEFQSGYVAILEVKPLGICKLIDSKMKLSAYKKYCVQNNLLFGILSDPEIEIPERINIINKIFKSFNNGKNYDSNFKLITS